MNTLKEFDETEILSKEEMKKITGGRMLLCTWSYLTGPMCDQSTEPPTSYCSEAGTDYGHCQALQDDSCEHNDCCTDVDCESV